MPVALQRNGEGFCYLMSCDVICLYQKTVTGHSFVFMSPQRMKSKLIKFSKSVFLWEIKTVLQQCVTNSFKNKYLIVFLWWNFLFVGKVFGFVWNEDEFIHLLGLGTYLCVVICTFPLQEIHDLFKDYEIKYCYVDRNKRTGENLKLWFISILWGTSCAVCEVMDCHSLSASLSAFFVTFYWSQWKLNFVVLIWFLVPSGLSQEHSSVRSLWDKAEFLWKTALRPLLGQTTVSERKTCPAPAAFAVCSHQETLLPWQGHPALL